MRGALKSGYGWRADCLGDMGGFSKKWNHMDNFYLQQVTKTGAEEAWRRAPVAFESCWDMRKWTAESWDVKHIFDYALRAHTSYVNNKSAPVPAEARQEVERFLKRIGYRLVIRAAEHPTALRAGDTLSLRLDWENLGVAPPYRDYRVAARLMPKSASTNALLASTSDISIRGWLPGITNTILALKVPTTAPAGSFHVDVAVVDKDQTPAVRLALPNRVADGWYRLSEVAVTK
jgi:hypothetical protein